MSVKGGWKWGLLAALTMAVLSLVPQFDLRLRRGADYQGAYAYAHYDEDFYATYLNGLILGRPRQSDPLVDRSNHPKDSSSSTTLVESYFSISLLTPVVLATVSRLFRLTTPQVLIAYPPLLALAAAAVLFLLLSEITGDAKLSALGAFFVLSFGALAGNDGKMIHLLDGQVWYAGFPFLRRYQPGIGFPLFFVFVLLIWRTATRHGRSAVGISIASGACFALLVFSNLYVWTAALAWLVIFTLLWLASQENGRASFVKHLAIAGVPSVVAIAAYGALISGIASNTATGQGLEHLRAPDLIRGPEIASIALLVLIIFALRRSEAATWRNPRVILALSFVLLPLAVFNQQVITGYSLQPFHYEIFIANYVVLTGAVLVFVLFRKRPLSNRIFWSLFLLVLAWAITEIRYSTIRERERNLARDAFVPVATRLVDLHSASPERRGIVFSPDTYVAADNIGGYTPLRPLWATHLALSPSLTADEREERFFQYLYYSGVGAEQLAERLKSNNFVETCALFGYERTTRHLTRNFTPVNVPEIASKLQKYEAFLAVHEREIIGNPDLDYVIVPNSLPFDYSAIDRWYQRDSGEDLGAFSLFRLNRR